MLSLLGLVLLMGGLSASGEEHSLTYIYTAFSKPVDLPGFHEFTAMGLLDGKIIDYFNSDLNSKIPKQPWMEKELDAQYWEKGTHSRKSKQRWFKANIDILMRRMRQNDSDVHVLQWIHGCKGEMQPPPTQNNTKIKFLECIDKYSYDGSDFLAFDTSNNIWVAAINAASVTKRKWDDVMVLKDYTKTYLERECIDWMSKFLAFEQKHSSEKPEPNVYVFGKTAKLESNIMLTCLATGFHVNTISLKIKRNGRVLTRDDGVTSSNVRPNEDATFQRRDSVEILKSDTSEYTCEVTHQASGLRLEKLWDGGFLGGRGINVVFLAGVFVAVVVTLSLAVGAVFMCIRKKKVATDEEIPENEDLLRKTSQVALDEKKNKEIPENGGPEKTSQGSHSSFDSGISTGADTNQTA
ncbi:H-2 class I histocompatibility antigen, Q10 alpha chain-like isoform 1-T1 [Aulostomus maculatus]